LQGHKRVSPLQVKYKTLNSTRIKSDARGFSQINQNQDLGLNQILSGLFRENPRSIAFDLWPLDSSAKMGG